MNSSAAAAAKLAQESAVLFKRSELIGREAVRFESMAKKIGDKTKPALKLFAEAERLQAESERLKAAAIRLMAESDAALPAAEIIGDHPHETKPQAEIPDWNVVDIEPLAHTPHPQKEIPDWNMVDDDMPVPPPPKPVSAPAPKPAPLPVPPAPPPVSKADAPPTVMVRPMVEILKQAQQAPVPQVFRAAVQMPKPVASPPKPEAPSVVLREVDRTKNRVDAQPIVAPTAKAEKPAGGFFKKLFGGGKPAPQPPRPAPPMFDEPTTVMVKPKAEAMKPTAPAPKPIAPPPAPASVAAVAPKIESPKISPPPPPVAPLPPKPAPASAPVVVAAKPPPPQYVTCHCGSCGQGVEFEAAQLSEDNNIIPCPGCGEDMTLSIG